MFFYTTQAKNMLSLVFNNEKLFLHILYIVAADSEESLLFLFDYVSPPPPSTIIQEEVIWSAVTSLYSYTSYLLCFTTAFNDEDIGINVLHAHPVWQRQSGVSPNPVHHCSQLHQERHQTKPTHTHTHTESIHTILSIDYADSWPI